MRLHVIVDPENKVEPKLPPELCTKYNIRTAHIDVDNDISFNQRERMIAQVIRMVLEEPEGV